MFIDAHGVPRTWTDEGVYLHPSPRPPPNPPPAAHGRRCGTSSLSALLRETFGYDTQVLAELARAGVDASFAPSTTKTRLRREIDDWLSAAVTHGQTSGPSRHPPERSSPWTDWFRSFLSA